MKELIVDSDLYGLEQTPTKDTIIVISFLFIYLF